LNHQKSTKIALILMFCMAAGFSAPDFSMTGYATTDGGTTGGSGGSSKTITTLQQLVDWGASREKNSTPEIITIAGKITGAGENTLITIKNGANITIQGNGTTGELSGVGLNIRDYNNVVIKNLKIHEVLYPDDALTLDNVQRAWVDHCELHSKTGTGITVDTYDGLLDIKKGSSAITISWCYLHDHMKCSLIGHTDNAGQKDTDSKIRVTYHHNYFKNTSGRNPSLRFGAVHMFNNYYTTIDDYGLASRDGGHAKVENCIYENVKLPMSTDKFPVDDLPNGYICQSGNLFTGTCGDNVISQTGCDFWNSTTLPYKYTLDPVNSVKETVVKYAGFGNNPAVSVRHVHESAETIHMQSRSSLQVRVSNSAAKVGGEIFDITGKSLKNQSHAAKRFISGVVLSRQKAQW
jgi:pectate lyase